VELIVRRGGEDLRVTVRRRGDAYEVTVGEHRYRVDAAATGSGLLSLVIDGAQHEAAVRPRGDGRYRVSNRHGTVDVRVSDPLAHLAAAAGSAAGGPARERVDAYMPGRVAAVLVAPGEAVEAGQGVVVLEAMKMENEIRAERAGVVEKVFVTAGQAVEGGDPLFALA
jgi:biotin carboxyl carrier protein